jgi:Flp pilus assembly protein TadB
MSGTRRALILGALPILVGVLYFTLQQTLGTPSVTDAAGATMLVALGLGMGFGMLVILRGARDL